MNKVTIDKNSRSVTLNMDGVEINISFNRMRALTSAGLDDAIAEAHGIDMSPEADAELAAACGEMEARKTGKLQAAIESALSEVDDHISDAKDARATVLEVLLNAVEVAVADDDVIREAYSRDYAKVLEATDAILKWFPEAKGNGGATVIEMLIAEVLDLRERLANNGVQPGEEDWVANLRKELLHSKMTHNFTFSRDEVFTLLMLQPGSPGARFEYIMHELEKRFPGAVDKFSSRAPEPEYLKAIDAVRTINSKTVLPERKTATEIGRILYERGWNACLDEMRRLNPHLKGPTYVALAVKPTLLLPKRRIGNVGDSFADTRVYSGWNAALVAVKNLNPQFEVKTTDETPAS